jgi:hypothetical protein
MMRHLRIPSVALLVALGPGALAPTGQADETTTSVSTARLSYMRLSEAAPGLIDIVGHKAPLALTQASRTGTEARMKGASPLYRPPLRGAPASRIGGGSRGVDGADWTLRVLAPEQTGLTTESAPTLYWYTSRAAPGPQIEVTIIQKDALDPVLETTLQASVAPGIQRLDLSRWGSELDADVEYEWFVSVVRDPAQRSNDITAGGTIRRVALDPRVRARLSGSDARAVPLIYAEQGIWYDAIDRLSRLIDVHPADDTLREQRAALLRQVGLGVTIVDIRGDE